jgi:AcrR family transcriptional regulator
MDTETQQENKKFRLLMNTARILFFKHGIRRITVEEICETANVSKVTFYKFFRNKDDLVMKIMEEWFDAGIREFQIIRNESIPAMEKMIKLIRLKLASVEQYSQDFIDEVTGSTDTIKEFYQQVRAKTKELVMDLLKEAQDEGQFRKNVPPEFYLYVIEQIAEMLNDDRLKAIIPDPHDRFKELMNITFFGFNECDKTIEHEKLMEV